MRFGIGSIWLTESILYGHAAMFMLAAAWTLREGGHVRVDVFYADARPRAEGADRSRRRAFAAAALHAGAGVVLVALCRRAPGRSSKRSRETSGIPAVFLLKTLIPVFALMMALQGVAQAIRAANALRAPAVSTALTGIDAARRNARGADGGRGLRPAVLRLSGGADARRRVACLRRRSATSPAR